MLRNLNREYSRGRICGTNKSGVLGSEIASTGEHGAGYAYSSLSLPADANNEYQGYITSVPAGLTIFAYEDTSFTASANDGTYIVPWELYENGVLIGTSEFTLTFGDGVIISCVTGNAAANGNVATINQQVVVSCGNGNSDASGSNATISLNVSIPTSAGNASADGSTATVVQSLSISCSVGNSSAGGSSATITFLSYTLDKKRTVKVKHKSRTIKAKKG